MVDPVLIVPENTVSDVIVCVRVSLPLALSAVDLIEQLSLSTGAENEAGEFRRKVHPIW